MTDGASDRVRKSSDEGDWMDEVHSGKESNDVMRLLEGDRLVPGSKRVEGMSDEAADEAMIAKNYATDFDEGLDYSDEEGKELLKRAMSGDDRSRVLLENEGSPNLTEELSSFDAGQNDLITKSKKFTALKKKRDEIDKKLDEEQKKIDKKSKSE